MYSFFVSTLPHKISETLYLQMRKYKLPLKDLNIRERERERAQSPAKEVRSSGSADHTSTPVTSTHCKR